MSHDTTDDITGLRTELFATLRALRDKDNPLPVDRARAISDVAGRIIDSAKVEVEHAKVTKQATASRFIPAPAPPALTGPANDRTPPKRGTGYVGQPLRGSLGTGSKVG